MNTTTSLQDDVKQLSQDPQLMLTAGRQALDSIMRILDGTHQPEAIGHDRLTRMAALIETSLPHRDALLVAAINPDTTRDDLTTITEQPHDPAAVKLIFTSLTTCFEGRTPVNQERADRAYNLFDQLTAAVGPPHTSAPPEPTWPGPPATPTKPAHTWSKPSPSTEPTTSQRSSPWPSVRTSTPPTTNTTHNQTEEVSSQTKEETSPRPMRFSRPIKGALESASFPRNDRCLD